MGRPKKNIEQHKREGTYRPHRHAGPEPETTDPVMPEDLTGAAAEAWRRIAPVVADMGVYTEADSVALRLLCESLGNYVESCEIIAQDGHYITQTNKNGSEYVTEHPAAKARGRHWKECLTLMKLFGLTPSSRTGLNIRKPGNDGLSDLDRILRDANN